MGEFYYYCLNMAFVLKCDVEVVLQHCRTGSLAFCSLLSRFELCVLRVQFWITRCFLLLHSSQKKVVGWTQTSQLDLERRWRQFLWPCAKKWAKSTQNLFLRKWWVLHLHAATRSIIFDWKVLILSRSVSIAKNLLCFSPESCHNHLIKPHPQMWRWCCNIYAISSHLHAAWCRQITRRLWLTAYFSQSPTQPVLTAPLHQFTGAWTIRNIHLFAFQGDDADKDPEAESQTNSEAGKIAAETCNSLESLYSGQSSSGECRFCPWKASWTPSESCIIHFKTLINASRMSVWMYTVVYLCETSNMSFELGPRKWQKCNKFVFL